MHGARGGAPEGERNGNYRHGARSKETITLWRLIKVDRRLLFRLPDTDWTKDLTPDEAQAALDALNANKASISAREAAELLKLKRVLEAKAAGR